MSETTLRQNLSALLANVSSIPITSVRVLDPNDVALTFFNAEDTEINALEVRRESYRLKLCGLCVVRSALLCHNQVKYQVDPSDVALSFFNAEDTEINA